MTALLLCVVSPVLLGYGLLRLLAPQIGLALQLSLGAGIGAGLLSCFFFLSLITNTPPLLIEAPALAVVAILCLKRGRVHSSPRPPWTSAAKFLAAIFALSATAGVIAFCVAISTYPNGGWDGWMIWNTRARFLATPSWRDGFSALLFYTHPDYPLLLPGFIARAWKLTGAPETMAPALAAGLFTFATAGVLVASLSALKERAHGFLAGSLLLGTHFFTAQGASEYADVPIGFFLLSALAAFALANRDSQKNGLTVLAGLAVGLAAWTKNEGWMLVAAAVALGLFAMLTARRTDRRPIALAAVGMIPVLTIVLFFKHAFAGANDYVGGRSIHSYLVLLGEPARYREILRGLLNAAIGLADHNFLIPALGLVICAACIGFDAGHERAAARVCAIAIAIIFAGYCATLLISPYEIDWQVATALDRLLLQLLPAALFTCFLALRNIGEKG